MALDTEVPDPPDLTNRGAARGEPANEFGSGADHRREELEAVLGDGAWREGFEEWAQYTDLSEADVERAAERGLFQSFDFFWDTDEQRLRYVAPAVPDDWNERVGPSDNSASIVQSEFDDLGRTVAETIATDYLDWGAAEPSDLVWSVDTFGQVPTGEEEE